MMNSISRRTVLAASAGFVVGRGRLMQAAVPTFQVTDVRTISQQSDRYHGWPTMIRRRNGELLVVCSGGRESHVCPFGRVELIRSYDNGENWTYARTLLDGPLDDRDAGIVETKQGTLLATTFTSLAYLPTLRKAQQTIRTDKPSMSGVRLNQWQAAHRRLADGEHEQHLGCWMIRSEDGGINWSPAQRVPVNSPHGPVNLSDGRLLYAGISLWDRDRMVGVWTSADDGRTWQLAGRIPVRAGDTAEQYHELHAVEAADGRIVVQIRNHNPRNSGETLQTHSTDGGKTFAEPAAIGVWGLPSHLLRLTDDRLLMSYGHRRKPLGNQIRISKDHGQTWSDAMTIYGEGASGDLGYPSTAEVSPGRFVTVWYEKTAGSAYAVLRMARWNLSG